MVELRGVGEVHRRKNILKAGTRLKEYHRILPTGGLDDVQHGDSMEEIRRMA